MRLIGRALKGLAPSKASILSALPRLARTFRRLLATSVEGLLGSVCSLHILKRHPDLKRFC